ncbi:hypothetical protein [Pseudodesulfovibrio sp.]|uniref:hypothetical protein n=1 Tax=Pseudodesulfovibrio sp. TaxID=2035812 RepID=UPI00260BDB2A|nr:hypothetical protein [Pseudodesulfovibrio sp.]MDD3313644.1 hypothetical protein [Pseudodesulfovibrio sp.]
MQHRAWFLLPLLLFSPLYAHAADLVRLLPDRVGELILVQRIDGPAAQAEVDKLHGKALPAEASVIGRYARPSDVGGERPAEVWVSRVASAPEASRQTGLMVHKMVDNPNSPFRSPRRLDRGGVPVYRFEGMGQVHLIWCEGDLVFWISTAKKDEQALLAAFRP